MQSPGTPTPESNPGGTNPGSLWSDLRSSLRQKTSTYVVTAVFGILTVFSDHFAGNIKSALNRANDRGDRYAALSRQLSGYVFDCELVQEYLANGWTTRDGLVPVITDYNNDITNLRRDEYANRAMLTRYWSKDRRNDFAAIMKDALAIDSIMHGLNDEFEKVNILKSQPRVDQVRATAAAAELKKSLAVFAPEVEALLNKLD
jgi:hypothetical protein